MSKLKKNLDEAFQKNAERLGESLKAVKSPGRVKAVKPPAAREPLEETEKKGPRNTAVSFTQAEYEFLKRVFETKALGMKVSTGIKMAALYVADRLETGTISMSRAGISERR